MTNSSTVSALPPLYVQPVPLEASRHTAWRLVDGDAAFAMRAGSVPVTISEFAAAARCYPIVFSVGESAPVVLMGLEGSNVFVEAGRWDEGAYVPAYVRRYPFVLIEQPGKTGFALGIDTASDRLATAGGEGAPLFEDGGQPAETTRQALEFCRLFNLDHQRTLAFGAALAEAGLLAPRRADVTLADGRKLGVAGFQVIDPHRFHALPDDKVLAWHRSGWLGLIHHHLASLDRFHALLVRRGRGAPEELSHGSATGAEVIQ